MRVPSSVKLLSLYVTTATPLMAATPVFADTPEGTTQIINFVQSFVDIATVVATVIGVGAFVYCGYLYIFAAGDMGKLKRAKDTFHTTFWGLVIIYVSTFLVTAITTITKKSFGS